MTAIVAVGFDWSIESCDKAPRDLDYERNTEKYGRAMKLTIVQIIFFFWSFEIMEYILRTRKCSYVKIHFLNKFEIFWYFSTYQSLRRLP